ncbi:DUF2855 family protein [uncultured Paraglaciecola sp.]|jgi:hypothetical protein|uniref:DUF2855 family protein n=1 Tax=uncultured Paraglaciecola sp. TaxID=1765024 RepID=UPI002603432A|nr:DUF2855 family protein [uncultured Paraglaciecola sp.]
MSKIYNVTEIWIEKSNVANTKIVEKTLDSTQLGTDEVLLKTDSFGFSANNVTYSIFGDKMGYWGFFPANETWGIVPMWGFATVLESNHAEVNVGEKVYGYLPMASHLVITAGKTSSTHFFDLSEKRKSISPVYDNYVRTATDPGYQVEREAWQLNYRPLFMTSFVLDDYVGEALVASEQSVAQVILTSASSKTAYGAAHLLMKHKKERGLNYQVIALTSANNKTFTQDLDCYDQVLSYDEIFKLGQNNTSWVLDFAGNKSLLLNLQKQFADNLGKLVLIGSTDVDAQQDKPEGHLDSEFFFAPSQVKKRSGEWGHAGFAERYAKAWHNFAIHMNDKVSVAEYSGAQAIEALYHTGLKNKLNNVEINVLKF